jgi:putative transposase
VTQRGNFQQETFLSEEDRERYIEWLAGYAKAFGTQFWAWCLMTNHVHFVAVPKREDSLARTFHGTHQRYSLYLNKRMKRCGHLWQGRFFSCPLDESHAYLAVRYVERNPVRAGLVAEAEEYAWSSARGHVYRCADALVTAGNPFERSIPDWKAYLSEGESDERRAALKRATLTGRPMGSDRFVERMEETLGRRLHALPRGRPRKEGKGTQ